MTNFERLSIEVEVDFPKNANEEQIAFWEEKMETYLKENGLNADDTYNPESKTNKKNILKTALSILESLANTRHVLQTSEYGGDFKFYEYYENLQNRIDALERKIRLLPDDENVYQDGASFVYIFKE